MMKYRGGGGGYMILSSGYVGVRGPLAVRFLPNTEYVGGIPNFLISRF